MRHTRWHLGRTWLIGSLIVLARPALAMAAALDAAHEEQPYRYVAVIEGDCEQLLLSGRDQTSGCGSKLLNVDFGDGRVAFVFTSPSERGTVATTFMGRTSAQADLRSYRLEVDEISTTSTDANGDPAIVGAPAAGHCTMVGDPTREPARFTCTVECPSGLTAATFRSSRAPAVYAGTRSGDPVGQETVAIHPTR